MKALLSLVVVALSINLFSAQAITFESITLEKGDMIRDQSNSLEGGFVALISAGSGGPGGSDTIKEIGVGNPYTYPTNTDVGYWLSGNTYHFVLTSGVDGVVLSEAGFDTKVNGQTYRPQTTFEDIAFLSYNRAFSTDIAITNVTVTSGGVTASADNALMQNSAGFGGMLIKGTSQLEKVEFDFTPTFSASQPPALFDYFVGVVGLAPGASSTVSPVPEPSVFGLCIPAVLGALVIARRLRKRCL